LTQVVFVIDAATDILFLKETFERDERALIRLGVVWQTMSTNSFWRFARRQTRSKGLSPDFGIFKHGSLFWVVSAWIPPNRFPKLMLNKKSLLI
jgi:hypothetical protein